MNEPCRGICQRDGLKTGTWTYGEGVAYCAGCEVAFRVVGRPKRCPCCRRYLRYSSRSQGARP